MIYEYTTCKLLPNNYNIYMLFRLKKLKI